MVGTSTHFGLFKSLKTSNNYAFADYIGQIYITLLFTNDVDVMHGMIQM